MRNPFNNCPTPSLPIEISRFPGPYTGGGPPPPGPPGGPGGPAGPAGPLRGEDGFLRFLGSSPPRGESGGVGGGPDGRRRRLSLLGEGERFLLGIVVTDSPDGGGSPEGAAATNNSGGAATFFFFITATGCPGPEGGNPPGAVAVRPPMTGSSTSICCVIGRGGSLIGTATLNWSGFLGVVNIPGLLGSPGPPGGPDGGPGALATRFPGGCKTSFDTGGRFKTRLDTRVVGCWTCLATLTGWCNEFFIFRIILFTNGVPANPNLPVWRLTCIGAGFEETAAGEIFACLAFGNLSCNG